MECRKINQLHVDWTRMWHLDPGLAENIEPWCTIEANHHFNFQLWHEEDVARRDDIPPERVCQAKRNIDRYNQQRNNAMEGIDDWVLLSLKDAGIPPSQGALHSETPGMMIDRLSIMALKEYHMDEQVQRIDVSAEHQRSCAERVRVLKEQQADLTEALRALLEDLGSGRRCFKVYRQFKMYNDPTLNPQLYAPKCNP